MPRLRGPSWKDLPARGASRCKSERSLKREEAAGDHDRWSEKRRKQPRMKPEAGCYHFFTRALRKIKTASISNCRSAGTRLKISALKAPLAMRPIGGNSALSSIDFDRGAKRMQPRVGSTGRGYARVLLIVRNRFGPCHNRV